RVVHVTDLQDDPEYASAPLRTAGFRSVLAVPILHDGEPIGVLGLWRRERRPFTDQQIALLNTFADQAVVAIENARLFKELQSSNRELRVALEQQTATSEILRVISSAPTDLQTVFDTIASSALRLCDGVISFLFRHDGMLLHLVALDSVEGVDMYRLRQIFPTPPALGTLAG